MFWLSGNLFLPLVSPGRSFKFVKICVDSMQAFAREQGVTALPRISVYRPGEGRLVTIDIPISRVKV